MLIIPKLGFTYDCPKCTQPVSSDLDVFTLRAGKKKTACACGKSALTARIEDCVLSVSYPCALCGRTHEAAFLPDRPLSGTLCALECRECGLPTGYVSTPEQIALLSDAQSERSLSDFILRYFGIRDENDPDKGDPNPD